MALPFYLSYIRSTPTIRPTTPPSPTQPLIPSPLRIFKRPSRKPSFTNPPLATLATPPAESTSTPTDSHRNSSTASPPSIYYSSTTLPLPPSPTPSSVSITKPSLCDLCLKPLSTLQTYSFPQTAPAVTDRVRRLFPVVSESPMFCGACFEAIHAVHICWGCGFPVYREEERVGCGWAWWHWGCVRCLLCRTPLPPPPWTESPITLPFPPSCKACTRELQHLAYQERAKKERKRRRTSSQQLLHSNSSYDGTRSRKVSLVARRCSLVSMRKASLGVKYPPLPKWMERRRSGAKRDEGFGMAEGGVGRRPAVPKWMEKLPGNVKGLGRRGGRVASGGVEKRVGKECEYR